MTQDHRPALYHVGVECARMADDVIAGAAHVVGVKSERLDAAWVAVFVECVKNFSQS